MEGVWNTSICLSERVFDHFQEIQVQGFTLFIMFVH